MRGPERPCAEQCRWAGPNAGHSRAGPISASGRGAGGPRAGAQRESRVDGFGPGEL